MSVTDEIKAAENALRDLIFRLLSDSDQELTSTCLRVTKERFGNWVERKEAESKRRDGINPETRILYFADLTDLQVIIHKNWQVFKDCFGDKMKFDVYLERLEELRNPTAHSRELAPFEVNLVAGICGEIRQEVTLYLSVMAGEKQHFPRIERVEDSFGNATSSKHRHLDTNLILRPGDTVTFICEAWDPDSLEVSWDIAFPRPGILLNHLVGNRVEIVWTVTAEDISDPATVFFGITSPRSYHRSTSSGIGADDRCSISYRVLPNS